MFKKTNLNPSILLKKNDFRKISCSWTFSIKFRFDSQIQVQSDTFDVSKDLESITTIKFIKRISSGTPKTWCSIMRHSSCRATTTCLASYTIIGTHVLGFSSFPFNFHTKISFSILLAPNSFPKHEIKNTNSPQNYHLVHFSTKPHNFPFSFKTHKQPQQV